MIISILQKRTPTILNHFCALIQKTPSIRRTAIAIFCLFILPVGVGLKAQSTQLYYDFEHSLYDKDLKGRSVLTFTVKKFHPDKQESTYFFVDMSYTSDRMATTYRKMAREPKFRKNPFSAHVEYNGGFTKGFSYNNAYLGGVTCTYSNASSSRGFPLSILYKYIQKHRSFHNFQLTEIWYMNFSRNLLTFFGFADWWREETAYDRTIFLTEPQFWVSLNHIKGISGKFNLSVGSEVELSNNFGGRDGFYVVPTLALRWIIN